MRLYNNAKIYKIGDCDWVYASDEQAALDVMYEMIGKEDTQELIEFTPVEELTDEEFNNGEIYWDDNGYIDKAIMDGNLISYQEALLRSMKDGSMSGHFMTTEY